MALNPKTAVAQRNRSIDAVIGQWANLDISRIGLWD